MLCADVLVSIYLHLLIIALIMRCICTVYWQVLERINTDRRYLDAEIREAMRSGAAKIRSNAPAPATAAAATTSANTTAATASTTAAPLTATAAALIGSNSSQHSASSNSISEGGSRRASRSDTVDVSHITP
jgi:predicted cobalt transporter CbtA